MRPDLEYPTPAAIEYLSRCAIAWARRYARSHYAGAVVDYEGAALEALARAVSNFDRSRGKFGSFATEKIRCSTREENRRFDQVGRTRRAEISAGSSLEPWELPPISLEHIHRWSANDADTFTVADMLPDPQVPDPETAAVEHSRPDPWQSLRYLPRREAQVIERHFRDGLTFALIARELELSESRVHQLFHRGMGRLRLLVMTGAAPELLD